MWAYMDQVINFRSLKSAAIERLSFFTKNKEKIEQLKVR